MTVRARLLLTTWASAVAFRLLLHVVPLVDIEFSTHDSWEYANLASSLAHYGVFGLDGLPKMNRTPAYPGFLAAIFATLGSSPLVVIALQVALDALTCVMVVHMALALRLRRAAVAAVAILAVTCLYTAAYSLRMMTEVLYTFLIVAAVWVLVATRVRLGLFETTTRRVAVAGLLLGCGVLTRPALAPPTALFAVLLCGWAVVRSPHAVLQWRNLRQLLAYGLAAAVVIAPWMLRNYTVFHAEYTKPDHSQVTLLGYKTDVATYRHWYSPQFLKYKRSNEEPFVMNSSRRPPIVVRYAYPGEQEDLRRAFAVLEADLESPEALPSGTLDAFDHIADHRYAAAPRLHVTAPVSRIGKFWVAPRITALWQDTSGANSGLALILVLTLYNLAYVGPGLLGLACMFRRRAVIGLFALAMIVGHTWMYTTWNPDPQSRYAIPLFPLLALGAGVAVHELLEWWLSRGARLHTGVPLPAPGPSHF